MDKDKKEEINSELEQCQREKDEYLNNWKRERADFINYKKDEARRAEEFVKFSNESMILELIDAIDAIEVARRNLPRTEGLKDWTEGFDSSLGKVDKFLNKYGVERIKAEGQKFDPLLHEAVEIKDKDGDRIEEIRPGYVMHGKVIRPARVNIVK